MNLAPSVLFAKRLNRPGAWDIPRTPTNEERLQAFRAVAPPVIGNGWAWKFHVGRKRG